MNQKTHTHKSQAEVDKIDAWFDTFIDHLESDKFLMKENLLSEESKAFYNAIINENVDEMAYLAHNTSRMHFIKRLTLDCLLELKQHPIRFKKLAFDIGASKVLCWVEIQNDDENSEDNLIMLEARLNARYEQYGFHLSTTIVEERDHLVVPPHYSVLV